MCLVPAGRISGTNFVRATSRSQINTYPTEMENLTEREVQKCEFAFSIYDADGSNVIDAVDLGNVLRALNLNPTNATIEKNGGTQKRGEKTITLEEFVPIYSALKEDKDQGGYEDFLECLKLYDKAENGMMLAAELSNTLLTVGEKLEEPDVNMVLGECMDPEDEDGFIPYAPFLRRMCDKAMATDD